MVSQWGPAVEHLHWGWDLWWKDGGWRVAQPPNSPQHLVWEDALQLLPKPPDAIFTVVRDPVSRMQSEYRWQRKGRRGTRLGKLLSYLPFPIWLRLMLAMATRHPHSFDNHLRPQADFVPENARVFHLEDGLDTVIAWLVQEAGLREHPPSPPHAISTGPKDSVRPEDAARISQAHAADYLRFGYEAPKTPMEPDLLDWLTKVIAPLFIVLDKRGAL